MLDIRLNGSIPQDAYILLIGAMKSGTTSLFYYLKNHPAICPSVVKEPEFFSSGLQGKNIVAPETAHIRFYEDLWNFDLSQHRYALEASTGYTKIPINNGVSERIFKAGIKPKFIYIVRNPFDRIESQLNHNFQKGRYNQKSTDDRYIYFSNYYQQLQQYTSLFPKEDILLLDYDQLNKAPADVLRKVYKFLGLDDCYIPAKFERHNVMNKNSLGLRLFKNRIIKSIFRKHRDQIIYFIDKMFPPPGRPKLTKKERQTIYSALYDDMKKLQAEFGVDVKKWGFF